MTMIFAMCKTVNFAYSSSDLYFSYSATGLLADQMKGCNMTSLSYSFNWQSPAPPPRNCRDWPLIEVVIHNIETVFKIWLNWWDWGNIQKQKVCGDDDAFMLNDCKYLYNMYRRYSMLNLVILLIRIAIMIIMYYVWADKMTYFCTNVSLLCTVDSIDVFFISVVFLEVI